MVNSISSVNFRNYNSVQTKKIASKQTNNQSLLAELFCKNFALYSSVVYESKYSHIDNPSKISSVLTAIYNAAYAFDGSKGYVFNTLAIKCIKQEFAAHTANLSYQKRKGQANEVSLEGLCEFYTGTTRNYREPEYLLGTSEIKYNLIETLNIINNSNLTENEKILCKAIIQDHNITNNELAELLNCHRHTVRAVKNSLHTKLNKIFG